MTTASVIIFGIAILIAAAIAWSELGEAESLLIGRTTYEGFSAAWPERDGEFADKMNSMPKNVVSSTLSEPLEWSNSTVVQGDTPAEIAKLKERDGGRILVTGSATTKVFGSGVLVHTLQPA